MDRNVFIAIILSIAILVGYQYYIMQTTPPSPNKEQQASKETPQEPAAKVQPQINIPAIDKIDIDKIHKDVKEKDILVENDLYSAVFTSKGGTIKSITLKNYTDKSGRQITLRGDNIIPPFALGSDENLKFSSLNFSTKSSNINLNSSLTTASLVFEFVSSDLTIIRTYTFTYDDYSFNLRDDVKGVNFYWVSLGKDFGIYEKDASVHTGPVLLRDTDRLEYDASFLMKEGSKSFKQGLKWIAQEDKYFFSAIVPKTPIEDSKVWNSGENALIALKMPEGSNNYLIYVGPKEYDRLKKYEAGLEHIVDYGFFSIIAIPLLWLMKLFYGIYPNYGVAIILLTIVTRIPFIPIISKGMTSMNKLQKVQPMMTQIREKYKKDPQKMNQELMALYKKNKVNPFGGCLPILLQIPVFFALFKILSIGIELRHAPFMLWIVDLSLKDPYYVLPIIMGATMVLQQKITPSTMDPKQQKLMMLLPVVFTFLFLTFASGLVLYWLINNILGIAQQFYMNKKSADANSS